MVERSNTASVDAPAPLGGRTAGELLAAALREHLAAQALMDELADASAPAAFHIMQAWAAAAEFADLVDGKPAEAVPLCDRLIERFGRGQYGLAGARRDGWARGLKELSAAADHAYDRKGTAPMLRRRLLIEQQRRLRRVLRVLKRRAAAADGTLGKRLRVRVRAALPGAALGLLFLYGGLALFFHSARPWEWRFNRHQGFIINRAEQEAGVLTRDQAVSGQPLRVGGQTFSRGLGTHAHSAIEIYFPPRFSAFSGACGADQAATRGTVVFEIWNGERLMFRSPLLRSGDPAVPFRVPVSGLERLRLVVDDGGDGIFEDHADWLDLKLE